MCYTIIYLWIKMTILANRNELWIKSVILCDDWYSVGFVGIWSVKFIFSNQLTSINIWVSRHLLQPKALTAQFRYWAGFLMPRKVTGLCPKLYIFAQSRTSLGKALTPLPKDVHLTFPKAYFSQRRTTLGKDIWLCPKLYALALWKKKKNCT